MEKLLPLFTTRFLLERDSIGDADIVGARFVVRLLVLTERFFERDETGALTLLPPAVR
jgi:hypothetical protein